MTDKEKKDVFLKAVKGVTEIKKDKSSNTKIIPNISTKKNVKKINIHSGEILPPKEKIIVSNIKKNYHAQPEQEKIQINKKIKKNIIRINKKIDLHGLSLTEAKEIFFNTIENCFFSDKRCILFITGKGLNKKSDSTNETKLYYGKIRENFLEWTTDNKVYSKILSTEKASPRYGGEGAFFVYLRKNKI